MFWGLIMEPNKRYTQTVEKSFHVSMASLDLLTADDSLVQVMVCYEDRHFLLCTLKKSSTWQVPLDLNFQEGTKIAFTCNGHGNVHLTGYLIPDEDLDLDELEEEQDEEEAPQLVEKYSKRKAVDSLKNDRNVKCAKREVEAESSDDEDIELDGLNEEDDSDESDEEEDESLMNEEEEDEDSDNDEDEEEEEEEEKKVVKPQQKDKKQKHQQQQQQQKKKEEKTKLVNGKEAKQEQQNKQQKKNKEQHQNDQNAPSEQKKRVLEGGVQVEELKVGNGAPAKPGKFVSVYYVGRLKNGKKFDSTTQGDGFKFRLGKGEVIKGWDVGIAGMKVGGKRRVTIPPALAYGAKGSPPVIPGNSTLVFEVELRNVH